MINVQHDIQKSSNVLLERVKRERDSLREREEDARTAQLTAEAKAMLASWHKNQSRVWPGQHQSEQICKNLVDNSSSRAPLKNPKGIYFPQKDIGPEPPDLSRFWIF